MRHLGGAAVVLLLVSPIGWVASDSLEQDNEFCNSCHLEDGVRFHIVLRRDFDTRPPTNLSALHAASEVEGRADDPAFRCIDCHGGVGLVGRAKVKLLAEPEAAALAYGSKSYNKNKSKSNNYNDEELILVFDLGGGTFDVSILKVGGGLRKYWPQWVIINWVGLTLIRGWLSI